MEMMRIVLMEVVVVVIRVVLWCQGWRWLWWRGKLEGVVVLMVLLMVMEILKMIMMVLLAEWPPA